MEHELEERYQEINDSGYQLSATADGLTLVKVTNATLDKNGHFTIPEGVTSIGNFAFSHCTSLTTVHIPEGMTSIGNDAFRACTSLTTVCIPKGVTSIGNYAFVACYSLTTVHIAEGVTSIGDYAFAGCASLTTAYIPVSVTSIGAKAFYHCTSLTNIIIDTDNKDQINKIKALLPENLRDKVISHVAYQFHCIVQREMVDRFVFEAAGGGLFDNALLGAGLGVTNVNKIIAAYLPEVEDRILEIINKVGVPACLPNDKSKITYRELLAQKIESVFSNSDSARSIDQEQHADAKQLEQNINLTLRLTSTLFTASEPERSFVSTRGEMCEEKTNECCAIL